MKSQSLAALLCCLAGSLIASAACATQLYSNGPLVTNPGAHLPSGDVSLVQDVTYPGATAFGITAGPDYRLTDDFSVPAGHFWTIDSATLFGYQTGSGDAAFTDARVIIWQGFPDSFNSTKLFDGTVSNNLVSSTPGVWRTAESFDATTFSNSERRVKDLLVAIPPLVLSGGTYWIDWQLKGPVATDRVFTPPVTILGQPSTAANGFARRKCPSPAPEGDAECVNTPGGWIFFRNGIAPYLVDLPFLLHGSDVVDLLFKDGFDTVPATP
ncbi:MAG: hypothetical protein IPP82_00925 [Xanthomonadales bacterium]|nr:hypothetical protein [Xanthomonadales bacterium]